MIDDEAAIAPRPLLLIAGAQNRYEVRFTQNYYDHAGEPKDLWTIPDAGHGDKWQLHPQEYEEHVSSFFDRWLSRQ